MLSIRPDQFLAGVLPTACRTFARLARAGRAFFWSHSFIPIWISKFNRASNRRTAAVAHTSSRLEVRFVMGFSFAPASHSTPHNDIAES